SLRRSFSRELALRVFLLAFEGKDACRIRELAWNIVAVHPTYKIAPIVEFGQAYFGDVQARQAPGRKLRHDFFVPNPSNESVSGIASPQLRPSCEQIPRCLLHTVLVHYLKHFKRRKAFHRTLLLPQRFDRSFY